MTFAEKVALDIAKEIDAKYDELECLAMQTAQVEQNIEAGNQVMLDGLASIIQPRILDVIDRAAAVCHGRAEVKHYATGIRNEATKCGWAIVHNLTNNLDVHRQDPQASLWRKACRMIYDACQEGSARGRPMDLIRQRDWAEIVGAIQAATDDEDKAAVMAEGN